MPLRSGWTPLGIEIDLRMLPIANSEEMRSKQCHLGVTRDEDGDVLAAVDSRRIPAAHVTSHVVLACISEMAVARAGCNLLLTTRPLHRLLHCRGKRTRSAVHHAFVTHQRSDEAHCSRAVAAPAAAAPAAA